MGFAYLKEERYKMSNKTFEEKLEHSKELLEKLMNLNHSEESVKLYEEGLKILKKHKHHRSQNENYSYEQANQNLGVYLMAACCGSTSAKHLV
jgi:hypothetical protein